MSHSDESSNLKGVIGTPKFVVKLVHQKCTWPLDLWLVSEVGAGFWDGAVNLCSLYSVRVEWNWRVVRVHCAGSVC